MARGGWRRGSFASALRVAAWNLILALTLLAAIEGVLAWGLNHPAAIPEGIVSVFREYYLFHDRAILQYQPECARYDPKLTYRLRTGSCRFENREFSTAVTANAHGFRDDEASLAGPEVIVVGDSHALGWGVSEREAFAARLESLLGKTVLNASMSSYGTPRELQALADVDVSRARWLVIQYAQNDALENLEFVRSRFALPISPMAEYEATATAHREASAYWPGKHVATMGRILLAGPRAWESAAIDQLLASVGAAQEAALFLRTLGSAPLPWSRLHVVVLEINGGARNRPDFIHALRSRVRRGNGPVPPERLHTLDTLRILKPEHYFRLDGHLRPEGHAIVAQALASLIRSNPRP